MDRALLYDWETTEVLHRTDEDVAFYVEVASSLAPGPVLELACGTGRVAAPLAERTGRTVVGLDIDHAMLGRARGRGVPCVAGDMARFALRPGSFAMVAIAWNSIQLLASDADRVSCLRCAGRTAPVLALEVTDFQRGVRTTEIGWVEVARGDGIVLEGALSHDLASRVSTYRKRWSVGGARHEETLTLRSLVMDELEALVAEAGGSVVDAVEDDTALLVRAVFR